MLFKPVSNIDCLKTSRSSERGFKILIFFSLSIWESNEFNLELVKELFIISKNPLFESRLETKFLLLIE